MTGARCTVVKMVSEDAEAVEAVLQAGEMSCPACGGRLAPWGYARRRKLRESNVQRALRPRRARCAGCGITHVLLPSLALLRRRDSAAVIVGAIFAHVVDGLSRSAVAATAGVPFDTARGWLRRFAILATPIRALFAALATNYDPELGPIEPRGSPEADAAEAIGVAAAAAVRRHGPSPLWAFVSGASGGRLLQHQLPLPGPC